MTTTLEYPTADRRLLSLETRRRIYDQVRQIPGIHLRRLERDLEIPLSNLQHHLRLMEEASLVTSRQDGKRRAYFVTDQMDGRDQQYLYYLRHRSTRRLLIELLDSPDASVSRLTRKLPIGAPTVSYHLKRLTHAGVVSAAGQGRSRRYAVSEPERLMALIDSYRPTFRSLAGNPIQDPAPAAQPVNEEQAELPAAEPESEPAEVPPHETDEPISQPETHEEEETDDQHDVAEEAQPARPDSAPRQDGI